MSGLKASIGRTVVDVESKGDVQDKSSRAISFLILVAVLRTLMTKWLLSGTNAFSYPVMYSAISCAATIVVIVALAILGEVELRMLNSKHVMPFVWISTLTALDMGATNIAVETISVALQQTIKASLPVMVVLLEVLMQGKFHGKLVYASLIPLTVGPVCAALGSSAVDFNLAGALWMLAACAAAAVKSVKLYSAIQLIRKDMGMISFLLWLEMSTLVILVPWTFANGEFFRMDQYTDLYSAGAWSLVTGVSLLGGLRAFATTMVLRYADPISLASANVIIQMITVILSILLFHTELTMMLVVGTVISLGGFALFTISKFRMASNAAPSEEITTMLEPDETHAAIEEIEASAAETQGLLAKPGFDYNAQLKEYAMDREWKGFGLASELEFARGQTIKLTQPKAYNALIRVLIILHFLTGIAYLLWISQNLADSFGIIIGPMFLIAEFASYIMRVVCFTQYWTKQYKAVCPLHQLEPKYKEEEWPIVQFCVTHYREPVHETHPTLKGLLEMDYPPDKLEINILDDGYWTKDADGNFVPHPVGLEMTSMIRSTIEAMTRGDSGTITEFTWEAGKDARPEAAEFGSHIIEFKHACFPTVRQICRRKGAVSHFKGGNLNNAIFNVLNDSRYQFFAFLDCDMVPTADFIQLTMPLFIQYKNGGWEPDYQTGMCQAPQSFSNVKSNGSDDPLAQVQDFYWRRTMTHLDRWGCVHYYGTNVLFFRPALEDSLGWQYGVLSEDTPTGANVAELGWKCVYLDQDIATGLCKDNVEETLIQRKRWAMGNMMWWMLTSPLCRWMTTTEFQNPPYWDKQKAQYARIKAAACNATTGEEEGRSKAAGVEETKSGASGDEEKASTPTTSRRFSSFSEVNDPEKTRVTTDPGKPLRQARMRDFLLTAMCSASYMHVKLSNQVAAFWFIAYMATAFYMMVMAGETSFTPNSIISLDVSFPAAHFVTTTTILYVIGPQSGMWRACQDRFAFAWVRMVAISEGMHMAMKRAAKAGPWNVKSGTLLIVPPLMIYGLTCAVWVFSMSLCSFDFDTCFKGVQSTSFFSAAVPVQLVGLFLGLVAIITMWPITRSSISNLLGFPMYKFRLFPSGSTWPYVLALSPLVMVSALWLIWGSPDSLYNTILADLDSSLVCVNERVAPSLFMIGCTHCGTTSLFADVTEHFPQIDYGGLLFDGEDESVEKEKSYFSDDVRYEMGMDLYLDHYSSCSGTSSNTSALATLPEGQIRVSADFSSNYLESTNTAKRIHESYSAKHRNQLRFTSILRDPSDRLFSYFLASRTDGSLDLTGYEDSFSAACLADPANCDDVQSLSFDDWAETQLDRAKACQKASPSKDLWPYCGDTGLFGGLYSEHLKRFLKYFDARQISIIRFEAFSTNGPELLTQLGDWLGIDYSLDDFTASSHLATTEDDQGETMSDKVREALEAFYAPYTDELYDLVTQKNVGFLDVLEEKDIF